MENYYHSISHLLASSPVQGKHQGICGVCGYQDDKQYPCNEILDKTASNITVLFPFNTDSMCAHCHYIWSEPKKWHRAILATPNQILFPLIAEGEQQSEVRPLWRDALKALDPALPRAMILTTDPKKRVWPKARISQGDQVCAYIHCPAWGISENVYLSLNKLITTLDKIEAIYNLGFSKDAIRNGTIGDIKKVKEVGFFKLAQIEKELSLLRSQPEFIPALIVAQLSDEKKKQRKAS